MIKITDNIWSIDTELTMVNVPSVVKKYAKHLERLKGSWIIDFSNCNKIDSAGLALIIEYIKYAKNNSIKLQLKNLSKDTISLSKVYGIESILEQYSS
ncbi:phospholipid transport system transporter-binding protein [Allofrancisella inopinata]|uniref:Anti-sigma factor antagonist n=1 Tax=Allofrancisella inopinata TaxID=1085647 RepID=A0AAE7CQ44_9GAMM|nr:STAS domain-containing protein [Allofrancisella inopinata]QIV95475.1 anti-sigma factor antagonist [Allofrancisella inopinata]TDT72610.1 phospholipid transport system transporter-binding protein [Allofrancisella inopinata]